jgi:hypothetical protein
MESATESPVQNLKIRDGFSERETKQLKPRRTGGAA